MLIHNFVVNDKLIFNFIFIDFFFEKKRVKKNKILKKNCFLILPKIMFDPPKIPLMRSHTLRRENMRKEQTVNRIKSEGH